MKYFTLILLLLTTFHLNGLAGTQSPDKKNNNRFSIEEYLREYDKFITQHACLTPSEAETVCPLLHQMGKEKRDIDEQLRRIYRRLTREQVSSEAEFEKGYKEIVELKYKMQQVENNCYDKMLKIISCQKLIKVMGAEERFNHYFLKQMMKNPPRPNDQRPHGPQCAPCENK